MNYLNSVLRLKLKSPKFSLTFNFSTKVIYLYVSHFPQVCCMYFHQLHNIPLIQTVCAAI